MKQEKNRKRCFKSHFIEKKELLDRVVNRGVKFPVGYRLHPSLVAIAGATITEGARKEGVEDKLTMRGPQLRENMSVAV